MISQTLFKKCVLSYKSVCFFRHLRGIVPREDAPKRIEGKVKTVTKYDPTERIDYSSYKNFIKSVEKSKLANELDIEKEFLNEDRLGHVTERCDMYYDMHLREEKTRKSFINKQVVGRKYFKLDKETNLLTYAAKEQIRYLHKLDPLKWDYKTLSECFPVSEGGVKKLLKSIHVLTSPEKIKLHDENVARKWEILKSGKPTDEIYPLTQKLYKEGKLVDDYFSGNPNLPTVPPSTKKVIELQGKEEVGEFSSIVKTYIDYQKQKLLENGEGNSNEKQITLRGSIKPENNNITKNVKKYKLEKVDDNDDCNPEVYPTRIKGSKNDDHIPFSQFKEILKEETSLKKSKYKNEYDDFIMQETSKQQNTSENPQNNQNCFVKIPKYNRESINLMYEKNKNNKEVYRYDEKLGYQHPTGKSIKGRINISSNQKNKKVLKDGHYVYDNNGEFLYRIP